MDTPIQKLLKLIPDGAEIKQAIFDNDMDEKMLDEWLWERLYKGKDWVKLEKDAIIDAYTQGNWEIIEGDALEYYNNTFTNQ